MSAPPRGPGGSPPREPDDVITDGGRPGGRHGGRSGAPWSEDVRTWTWSTIGDGERSVPWLPVMLIVIGTGLLIELLVPELSFGSLVILAIGGVFAVAWLWSGIVGATVPALVLIAWALSRIATELGIVSGDGWSTLLVGLAFLAGWALARIQDARRQWALWIGAILVLIGLADVSDALPIALDFAIVIPLAIIAVGLYLIYRDRESFRGFRRGS